MTVFVTGATGHLGSHLVRALLEDGHSVRAFVRHSSNLLPIAHLDIEIRKGALLDARAVREAMTGCDAAFHLAAPTRVVDGLFEDVVAGTRNVLDAAGACGVSNVVYTSSIATIGYSPHPTRILDESNRSESSASLYHTAKYAAESIAIECAGRGIYKLVVVNPATIVGSLDYRITPSNEVIDRGMSAGLPITFDSGLTIAPVRDVARGHILALQHGKSGERYILGGEMLTIPQYFRLIEDVCGKKRVHIKLPRAAMLGIGAGFTIIKAIGPKAVPFTYTQARELVGKYGFYSSQKAVTELGYSWKSAKDAIEDYVGWVRAGRPSRID
jgi:dihydroflavonol-4-reductase